MEICGLKISSRVGEQDLYIRKGDQTKPMLLTREQTAKTYQMTQKAVITKRFEIEAES